MPFASYRIEADVGLANPQFLKESSENRAQVTRQMFEM